MAQLRDAKTSEFLAEGTPEEVVLMAEKIGRGEVIFDGVGEMDPDAVLEARKERLAGLEAAVAAGAEPEVLEADKKVAVDALKDADTAEKRLAEARELLDA